MRRWGWIAVLVLAILIVVVTGLYVLRSLSAPSSQGIAITDQIYVSQVSNTVLQALSAEKAASQPSTGDMIDFRGGETLSTAETGYGYVQLGFPGQVEVYLASGTETILKDPADERISIDMLLTRGWVLARLPQTFSASQRVVVGSPEGAQVWASGSAAGALVAPSVIGAQYLSATHELYVDCLKGQCGYTDGLGSHVLPEGSHVSLNGKTLLSGGPGNRSELWQFVPNMIAAPTLIPSATPNLAATQSCRYFTSLGLPCDTGFPTLTITPSATPNAAATQHCARSRKLGTPCP